MNHTINKHDQHSVLDPVLGTDINDDTTAGLRSQMDTTKQLIVNLQGLGAEE